MTAEEIATTINQEWWKSSSRQEFVDAAETLLNEGWAAETVLDFLAGLHSAVADEYGG